MLPTKPPENPLGLLMSLLATTPTGVAQKLPNYLGAIATRLWENDWMVMVCGVCVCVCLWEC